MEARELVELAALVAAHGPVLVANREPPAPLHFEQYWVASRCRIDRWSRTLRQYERELEIIGPKWAVDQWHAVEATLEEVLTSEVLTRVWTAVVSASDRQHGRKDGELVVRSVLVGHMEARHRVLRAILHTPANDAGPTHPLNQLRKRCERWTDVLVGYLLSTEDVSEFAFSPERAREFADSLDHERRAGHGPQSWKLTLGSLRAAFRTSLTDSSANADLNAHMASSILNCFPPSLFDDTGLVRSIWLTRMQNITSDTQGLLSDLLSLDSPPDPSLPLRPRW